MKLNYRDKVILIVLAVLLVLVGGIMLFVKPAIDECNTASDQLEAKKVELADLKAKNKKDANLKSEIADLKAKTNEVAENFFDFQVSYNAVKTVADMFNDDSVKIEPKSLGISTYGSTVLSPYLYTTKTVYTDIDMSVEQYDELAKSKNSKVDTEKAAEDAATGDAVADATAGMQVIGCYELTVDFKSTLEGFKTFSQNITTRREKSMVIKNVVIDDVTGIKDEDNANKDEDEVNEDEGKVHGTMTLQMIVLKKIAD